MVEATAAPVRVLPVTIRKGESLSEAIDTGNGAPTMLYMPPGWNGKDVLSFQVSADGSKFSDLFTVNGIELVREIVRGTAVVVDTNFTSAILWLKIRAGTRDKPIPQDDERVFYITVAP